MTEVRRDLAAAGSGLTRRSFLSLTGAGLLFTFASPRGALAAADTPASGLLARLHFDADGGVTLLTGKVEVGQGARTELAMAVAEELDLAADRVQVVMGDTDLVPDDGGTYGSQTTPRTVPTVRQAAAAARRVLTELAARRLEVEPGALAVANGDILHAASGRRTSYGELASDPELVTLLGTAAADGAEVRAVSAWQVLGLPRPRHGAWAIVTGAHRYPSDVKREGMLYGAVLRPSAFGATLRAADLDAGRTADGARGVRDGDLVGVVAPSAFGARRALDALAASASWQEPPSPPASSELEKVLRARAGGEGSGLERQREWTEGEPDQAFAAAAGAGRLRRVTYQVAYIQHTPLEPRAAVAEWQGDRVTVWTGTQVPFGVRREVAQQLGIGVEKVRVIVPDTGGAFGGKHTGECAVEAARLARAAGKPVSLRWTREEELTWAYFRPAGVIDLAAGLERNGRVDAWEQVNLNSGASALRSPYRFAHRRERYQPCDAPLRQGSYRALAATANTFAREAFLDELASGAGADPLDYRLAHLDEPRLRAVLQSAATSFGWADRRRAARSAHHGIGLACGTEKGSFVAACAEIALDPEGRRIGVERVVVAFECGAILNPDNLRAQVEGGVIMGLGGALREQIRFEGGRILEPRLKAYPVPRFSDVPAVETVLVDRPDLPSVGAGETPMIALAPAIANAFADATGSRLRSLPLEPAWRDLEAAPSSA